MANKPKPDRAEVLRKYREIIPRDVREEILTALLDSRQSDDFEGFISTARFITAHILVGNIPAEVADSVKGYLELIFTATTAHQLASGGGKGKTTADSVARARKAARGKLEARVNLEETPEGLKVNLNVIPSEEVQ